MKDVELKPDTYIEELPFHVVSDIAAELNKDDSWLKIAEVLQNALKEFIFREEAISNMRRSASPGQALLDKLKCHNLQVQQLQNLLKQCQLFSILNKVVTNVPVEIKSPVSDVPASVKLGETIDIIVDVDGSPYPECQWYFMGTPMPQHTSSVLTINNFSIGDMGEYFCHMKQNLKGKVKEYSSPRFILDVERLPPEIVVDLSDVELSTGRELVLTFEAVGYPEPKDYIWFKNDEFFAKTSEPTLKIQEVDTLVSGLYYCNVRNNEGNCTTRPATVKVVPPILTPGAAVVNEESQKKPSFCLHNNEDFAFSASEDKHRLNLLSIITEDALMREDRKPLQMRSKASLPAGTFMFDSELQMRDTHEDILSARNKWALLVANSAYKHEGKELYTPTKDIKILARELVKLQFRVMMYSNLKRTEFINAIRLFSKFLHEGDYVVFYFAGHGFINNGIDFMQPLDVRLECVPRVENVESPLDELPCQEDCITTTYVTNIIQDSKPALLFSIYDSCRTQLSCGIKCPPTIETHNCALANSYTLYATSENYSSYEMESSQLESSLLMKHLKDVVGKPIPVEMLGQKVKESFYRHCNEAPDQIPKSVCDLALLRSLADPSLPLESDIEDGGVLHTWEMLGSVGGKIQAHVRVRNCDIRVNVQCTQEELANSQPFQKGGPTWVISNCIYVWITLTHNNEPFDTRTIDEEGLDLIIKFSTEQELHKELKGKTSPVVCSVDGIQSLKEYLSLDLRFVCKGDLLCQKLLNLQKPSISKKFSSNNDLS